MRSLPVCIFLFFIAQLSNAAVNSSICQEYITVNDEFNCGTFGYPLYYGYKNCEAFTNPTNLAKFDAAGQAWVDCTATCLVNTFKNISETSTTCSELETKAFQSHIDCYLGCGFCSICYANKVALASTYDLVDFLNLNSIVQVLTIFQQCNTLFTCLL